MRTGGSHGRAGKDVQSERHGQSVPRRILSGLRKNGNNPATIRIREAIVNNQLKETLVPGGAKAFVREQQMGGDPGPGKMRGAYGRAFLPPAVTHRVLAGFCLQNSEGGDPGACSFLERREVSFIHSLRASFEHPPHDLAASRLGKACNKFNRFGFGDRADLMNNVLFQLLPQDIVCFDASPEDDIGMDRHPLDLMREADHGRLCNRRMADQGRFQFRCPQAIPAHLDHIIHAPDDPVVPVFIFPG